MGEDKLTSKHFWKEYWDDKKVAKEFVLKSEFADILKKETKGKNLQSMIEIGGFPGYFPIYFKKQLGFIDVAFVDFIYDKGIFKKVLKVNGMPNDSVTAINKDIFKITRYKKYDLVFSYGFIEHFQDLNKILTIHKKYLKKGGKMIIVVPNFLGINGIVQLLFDYYIFTTHNLRMMDVTKVKDGLKKAGFSDVRHIYYDPFYIWMERLSERSRVLQNIVRIVNGIAFLLTPLGINGKLVSSRLAFISTL